MSVRSSYPPMLKHYLELKEQHPDALLFYRMGDFYELFFEDAKVAAPVLEVVLTARHKGSDHETPMCGVPHHALDNYVGRALKAGFKVAICEQMEDPAKAKGLVRREVIRVVTPGTLSEPALLEGKEANLLAAVVWQEAGGAGAFLDISTADFFLRRWQMLDAGLDDLEVLRPQEVVFVEGALPEVLETWITRSQTCRSPMPRGSFVEGREAADLLRRQLGVATLSGFGLDDTEPAVDAAAAALTYARDTQRKELTHIKSLSVREAGVMPVVDATTLANLDVFRNQREGTRAGTLLSVLDRTTNPPGGRLLKTWLRWPLTEVEPLERRHTAVAELLEARELRVRVRELLPATGDPERLLSRAVLGSLTPKETAALREGLRAIPEIFGLLAACGADLLRETASVDPLPGLLSTLEERLEENPAASLKDGGVIAAGVNQELDECRDLARDSKRHVLALEGREKDETGISSLKVRYNRVFGYYLEVTRANLDLVPERYIRKQTLANAERYVTPELKELEEQILKAEERQLELEEELFARLREHVASQAEGLRALARALAQLDCLAALAEVADARRYIQPHILPPGDPVRIEGGRHPVVEVASREPFVPNDVLLDDETQIVLLTGPNMGGKSTYLRQVALIILMAQAGSFVPASKAEIGVVDRIFTRVGASDDLIRGESTFMVEMVETARILHQSTNRSVVILDEVGRGTATFDGLSLAWAIVESLHQEDRPRTLFATHFHELTELEAVLPRLKNRKMAVKEWGEQIVFLHRVVPGSADKSYGLQVARLAGLPPGVIERAAEVLENLEAQEYDLLGKPRLARGRKDSSRDDKAEQMRLFAAPEEVVAAVLRETDVEQLTPLAALNLVNSLKERLK